MCGRLWLKAEMAKMASMQNALLKKLEKVVAVGLGTRVTRYPISRWEMTV